MRDELRQLSIQPSKALEIGKAAEHLACADLILSGYRCFLSDQGLPYDLIADVAGHLYRIQVKSACFPKKNDGYTFSIRRRGKAGSQRLGDADADFVALVALDIKTVAYFPIFEMGQACRLKPPSHVFRGKYIRTRHTCIDTFPFSRALERFHAGPSQLVAHKDTSLIEINGERKTLTGWSLHYGMDVRAISCRIGRGWPIEKAITTPAQSSWARKSGDRAHG